MMTNMIQSMTSVITANDIPVVYLLISEVFSVIEHADIALD